MKVLNIILEARVGGPQLRIAGVAKELNANFNIETVVVFPKKNSERYRCILDKHELKYHTLSLHKLTRNIFRCLEWLIFFIPETLLIKKVIKRENPDIIHCNGCWQWKGVTAGKLSGKKVIWHLNDSKMGVPIKMAFYFFSKMVDGYIFSGTRVKSYYGNYLKKGVISAVIDVPVDVGKFDPAKVEPGEKKDDRIKIITVSNINPVKGLKYFIESAYILNQKYDNLEFYIVGIKLDSKRNYYEELKSSIRGFNLKNIHFPGFKDDIPSLLKTTNIFICSSIAEAGPMTVFEAMAMEKAIVSTDVGSVPDFIKDGENGFIVPIKNPGKMAEKIGMLIENAQLREIFGKRARKTAVQELDVKIAARKHMEVYERIANLNEQ